MHLPKPFFKSIHGFSLVWKEKQYLKGVWGELRRKCSRRQLICALLHCVKIDTKMAA